MRTADRGRGTHPEEVQLVEAEEERRPDLEGLVYEGVLFDLFGTLVDFRTSFDRTLSRLLEDYRVGDQGGVFLESWRRFAFQGEQDGVFMTVREDFESSLATTLREMGVEGDLEKYAERLIDDLFESLRVADLYPEVQDVITTLEENGVAWGIVSNVDEGELLALVDHHGLSPTVSISSEAVKAYKPEAEIFEKALLALGLPASRVIHVGDSPSADVGGASKVGMGVAWVNRYGSEFPKNMPRPRWEIPDLSQVPRIVREG